MEIGPLQPNEIKEEAIIGKIFLIRGHKVMLDTDLAEMYEVGTKVLKQAVKRNIDIFPEHFMFELTQEEFKGLRSQFVTSNRGGHRYLPYAFTEHGVLQLAGVLRSPRARLMSIRIIEVFVKMREILLSHKDLLIKFDQIQHLVNEHDDQIQIVFNYLKQLEKERKQEFEQQNRPRIGYKQGKSK